MAVNREAIRALVDQLQRQPFPTGSGDEVVGGLHADLAEYDGHVTGILSQLASKGKAPWPLERDAALRKAIEAAARSGVEPRAHDAQRLLAYLDTLDEVLRAVNILAE